MSQPRMKFQSRIVANWDRVDTVEGRVVELGTADLDDRKADYLLVSTGDGDVQVFKSAGLSDLFEHAAVGDFVRIKFLEKITTKGGQPFRKFQSSCWEEPDAPKLADRPKVKAQARGRRKA